MHTCARPYKAQKASTQQLNEHIKKIQLIQNLPEPHVYSTRSQDFSALSDLKGRRSARVCGGQLYFPAQDPNLNPHFHCYWETTPIMYLYCMCKNPPTKGRPWSEHRNGERQPLSMQCDSVLHDMYHQHANFLVALNCGGYFPRTSTKTRLFLFSSKQPLQGNIYIFMHISHHKTNLITVYICCMIFCPSIFRPHTFTVL